MSSTCELLRGRDVLNLVVSREVVSVILSMGVRLRAYACVPFIPVR